MPAKLGLHRCLGKAACSQRKGSIFEGRHHRSARKIAQIAAIWPAWPGRAFFCQLGKICPALQFSNHHFCFGLFLDQNMACAHFMSGLLICNKNIIGLLNRLICDGFAQFAIDPGLGQYALGSDAHLLDNALIIGKASFIAGCSGQSGIHNIIYQSVEIGFQRLLANLIRQFFHKA